MLTVHLFEEVQDVPIPLFHLLLHCFYLKRTNQISEDAFSYCWDNFMFPKSNQDKLILSPVLDITNKPIKTLSGRKNLTYNEKKISSINRLTGQSRLDKIKEFKIKEKSNYSGNGGSMSIRKYCLAFLRHVEVIDSENNITEYGFKLYQLGLLHGPNSKMFRDYFTKSVLLSGHHLDLIFDLDKISIDNKGLKNYTEIKQILHNDYESKGMVKTNPRRISGTANTVNFLKYEDILWNALGLKLKTAGKPEISFNWKKIIEVCSLPEL